MLYASGSSLARFPPHGHVLSVNLRDQGQAVLRSEKRSVNQVPVLGLMQVTPSSSASAPTGVKSGRLALYGDSNCLDSAHLQKDCFWLLEALLQYCLQSLKAPPSSLQKYLGRLPAGRTAELPERMEGSRLARYSKVRFSVILVVLFAGIWSHLHGIVFLCARLWSVGRAGLRPAAVRRAP